jgi:UDP-N-acetyl-D-galactosamine dehydrogenase
LTYKAKKLGVHPEVILSGRHINDSMPKYIAKKIVQHLSAIHKPLVESKVLVMGVTFKENVEDIRNSKVVDLIYELQDYGITLDCIDPHAKADAFFEEYGLTLTEQAMPKYDVVVLAVAHKAYIGMDDACFKGLLFEKGLLFDLKGLYRKNKVNVQYLTL